MCRQRIFSSNKYTKTKRQSLAERIGVWFLWSITDMAILYDIWRLKGDGISFKRQIAVK